MANEKEGDQSRGKGDTDQIFAEQLERDRILYEALSAYESAKGADTNTETASNWLCLYLTEANHTLASAIKFLEAFVSVVASGGTTNDRSFNWPTQYAIERPVVPSTVNYVNLRVATIILARKLSSIASYFSFDHISYMEMPLIYRRRSIAIKTGDQIVTIERESLFSSWKIVSLAINQKFSGKNNLFSEQMLVQLFCEQFGMTDVEISEVLITQVMEFLRHNFGTVDSNGLTRLLPSHEEVLVCTTSAEGYGSQLRVPFSDASSIAPRSVIAVEI